MAPDCGSPRARRDARARAGATRRRRARRAPPRRQTRRPVGAPSPGRQSLGSTRLETTERPARRGCCSESWPVCCLLRARTPQGSWSCVPRSGSAKWRSVRRSGPPEDASRDNCSSKACWSPASAHWLGWCSWCGSRTSSSRSHPSVSCSRTRALRRSLECASSSLRRRRRS